MKNLPILRWLRQRERVKNGPHSVPAQLSAGQAGLSARETARAVSRHAIRKIGDQPGYRADLLLIALLALAEEDEQPSLVDFVRSSKAKLGQSYEEELFCSLTFALHAATRDSTLSDHFVSESERYLREVERTSSGAITFFANYRSSVHSIAGTIRLRRDMEPMLLDHLQEYAGRMAKTAWLTGDARFSAEAAGQIALYREALRDAETGLWAHGCGWYGSSGTLVPVYWGRSQAWLLRGLVEAAAYLPKQGAEFDLVTSILHEFALDLARYQDHQGFWHQVVNRADSYPETSGTAMMSHYLNRAVKLGLLASDPYAVAAERANRAMMRTKISADGHVFGACHTAPPLPDEQSYLDWPAPVDDSHGLAAVILSLIGSIEPLA